MLPRPWLILAVAALMAGVWAHGYFRGAGHERARYAAIMAEAQVKAAARQKALVAGVEKAAEEAYAEQVALEHRLAGADDALGRLRAAVDAANRRADTASAAAADGVLARTLLAECAGEYREVAERADRLRAIAIGLQAYAREVSE